MYNGLGKDVVEVPHLNIAQHAATTVGPRKITW